MKNFVIIGDSTCDLNKETRLKYDIEYLKMRYIFDDTEHNAYLDWDELSAKEFYDLMRNGTTIRTTQVPRQEIVECFTYWLEKNMDILYVACSSALSGSVNLAKTVAEELLESFPGRKIFCVDSLRCSLGQGHLLTQASDMRSAGHSIEEVVSWLEDNKQKINQCGTVDTLEYLRRAGRIKAASAFFGNIFGVKPLIISDIHGSNYAYRKVKGAANARKEIALDTIKAAENIEDSILYIAHADDIENALKLRDEVLALGKFKEVYIDYVGPIVGASVGPGTLITYVYGKQVTIEGKE